MPTIVENCGTSSLSLRSGIQLPLRTHAQSQLASILSHSLSPQAPKRAGGTGYLSQMGLILPTVVVHGSSRALDCGAPRRPQARELTNPHYPTVPTYGTFQARIIRLRRRRVLILLRNSVGKLGSCTLVGSHMGRPGPVEPASSYYWGGLVSSRGSRLEATAADLQLLTIPRSSGTSPPHPPTIRDLLRNPHLEDPQRSFNW